MKLLLAALLGVLPMAAQPAPVQSFRLENGLRVLLLEDHQHPVFHLQLAAARQFEGAIQAVAARGTT